MGRIEKTVFISYRRANFPWAFCVYQDLTHHGFDVFFDYKNIDSGSFEKTIIENIRARAHFVVILSSSALEKCNQPGDWLRREIETAMDEKRNIIPVMLEGFDFGSPSVKSALTGKLSSLNGYNGMNLVAEYVEAGFDKLRNRFLSVALEDVQLHPLTAEVKAANEIQKSAASEVPQVEKEELIAQEWFEKGYLFLNDENLDEAVRCLSEAINLKTDNEYVYTLRGIAYTRKGDIDIALPDFDKAIQINPNDADYHFFRAQTRYQTGNLDGSLEDYTKSIQLAPKGGVKYFMRGTTYLEIGDIESAISDFTKAISLKFINADVYINRGMARGDKGDIVGAIKDFAKAIHLSPNYPHAYLFRAGLWEQTKNYSKAITDYQTYIDLGGDIRYSDKKKVKGVIRNLKKKMK